MWKSWEGLNVSITYSIVKLVGNMAFNILVRFKEEPKKYSLGYFIFHAAGKTWVWASTRTHASAIEALLKSGMTMQQINYHLAIGMKENTP